MINVSPNAQQADCHLIQFPDGRNVLIDIADAADAGGAALSYLKAHHINRVDLVVISHFHRDHYGRLKDLVSSGVQVDRVAFNMPDPADTIADGEAPWGFDRQDAYSVIRYLKEKGVSCFTPHSGDRLIEVPLAGGGTASLDVVCLYDGLHTPVGKTDTNDTSVIVRLSHCGTRALFTGDLNAALGGWLATSSFDLGADILKAPHHGTEGCAPNIFFDRVHPKAVLVPGPKELWLSPRSARIRDYFAVHQIPAYVSGVNGNITVTFRRTGYTVDCERGVPE